MQILSFSVLQVAGARLRALQNSIYRNATVQPTGDVIERLGRLFNKGLLDGVMIDRLRNSVPLDIVAPRANSPERQQPKQPREAPPTVADPLHPNDIRRALQRVDHAGASSGRKSIDQDLGGITEGAEDCPLGRLRYGEGSVNDV